MAYSGEEQVFESGLVGDGQAVEELDPEDVWMLHDRAFKADGSPAHMFWDVARVEPGALPTPNVLFPGSPGYRSTSVAAMSSSAMRSTDLPCGSAFDPSVLMSLMI